MDEKAKNDRQTHRSVHELAGIVDRLAANIIDSFLLILPLAIANLIFSQPPRSLPDQLLQVVGLAVPIAYHWYFWTRRAGQTPGKFALGIRVIKVDGSALSDTDALIRAIGYHVSAFVFGLGFIWAIVDKNNQTWHDKLARTYVVRSDRQRKTVELAE